MSEPSPANMGLWTSYDILSQTLYITVEIYYTEDMPDENHVYVLLSENDLISTQSGASGPYTHKHTFREAFVEQWGDAVPGPTTQGSLVTLDYEWDVSGSGYVMSNCEVLAFIENQSDGEIITGIGVHVGDATYIEPTAGFSADLNNIGIGGTVTFTDESTGYPTAWEWTFEGGDPASSTLQSPPPVTYAEAGLYGVTLVVTNPAGNSTLTISDFINVGNVGIAEAIYEKPYTLYPNPCREKLHIIANASQLPEQVRIRNAGGQVVMTMGSGTKGPDQIDLSSLEKGIYFVEIIAGGSKIMEKVVKQ